MATRKRHIFTVAAGPVANTFGPATCDMLLKELRIHISAAPTTAGTLSLTLESVDGAAYDTVIYSIDPSTASTTDVLNTDLDVSLIPGDSLTMTYANADLRTLGVQMLFD